MNSIVREPAIYCTILLLCCSTPVYSQVLTFTERAIDSDYAGMSCVELLDLDGDGDLDIIGGSETTPTTQSLGLAWWRNEGGNPPSWTRFTIDSQFSHVMSVDVAYVDSDNLPDIIATSWSLNQIAWWKNSGSLTAGWTKTVIRSSFTNAHDAEGADLNGDGYTDIVGINSTPGSVIVCTNNGADPPGWSTVTLSSSFGGGKSVSIHDLDRDGDPDIIGTAADANRIAWWENQGGNPVSWNYRPIAANFSGAHDIDLLFMNSDSLYDILATGWLANEVAYWIRDDLASDSWTKSTISNELDIAVQALGSDFDLDGDIDVVAMGKIPGELILFENDDFTWSSTTLKQNFEGGWALTVVDMDRDGDTDIVSGASGLGELVWWENRLINLSLHEGSNTAAKDFRLFRNYPNPFNTATNLHFDLLQGQSVELVVFDLNGREVDRILEGYLAAGSYQIPWEGTSLNNRDLPTGIYIARLSAAHTSRFIKLVLLK
jgi:hypothetical protein